MLKRKVRTIQVIRRERRGSNLESLGRDRIIGPSVKSWRVTRRAYGWEPRLRHRERMFSDALGYIAV